MPMPGLSSPTARLLLALTLLNLATFMPRAAAVHAVELDAGGRGLVAQSADLPADGPKPTEPAPASASPPSRGGKYVVQPGDTLFSIARRNNVGVDSLVWANKLSDADTIRVGQTLTIPPSGTLHTVEPGETVFAIARLHGAAPADIVEINKLSEDGAIRTGQRILVPIAPAAVASPPVPEDSASAAEPVIVAAAQSEAPTAIPVGDPPTPEPSPAPEPLPASTPSAVSSASTSLTGVTPAGGASATVPAPTPSLVSTAMPTAAPMPTVPAAAGAKRIPVLAWPIALQAPRIVISQGFRPGHRGIDIAAPTGTAIKAMAAGVVKSVEKAETLYGWKIIVDHGDGVHTWYAHLSAFAVAEGDRIQAGQTIGSVGSTGLSTGPHLHFELRVDDVQLDPRTVLP